MSLCEPSSIGLASGREADGTSREFASPRLVREQGSPAAWAQHLRLSSEAPLRLRSAALPKKRSKSVWGAGSAKLCHGSRVELQVVLVSRAWDDTAKGTPKGEAAVMSLTQALACFAAIPHSRPQLQPRHTPQSKCHGKLATGELFSEGQIADHSVNGGVREPAGRKALQALATVQHRAAAGSGVEMSWITSIYPRSPRSPSLYVQSRMGRFCGCTTAGHVDIHVAEQGVQQFCLQDPHGLPQRRLVR